MEDADDDKFIIPSQATQKIELSLNRNVPNLNIEESNRRMKKGNLYKIRKNSGSDVKVKMYEG